MSSSSKREHNQDQKVLETLSGDFAFKLRGEHPPRIEDVLANVALDQREALLRRLIAAELAEGGRTGKESSKQEYLDRFPKYKSCLEELFPGTMLDEQGSVDTDSMAPTAHFAMPKSRRIGSYLLEGELGRGGMGVVHLARHANGGETVALKILPEVGGASLHRFKREFRSLADISHPNLISLFNLESDGEHWFFTMELLRGAKSFCQYVRPRGGLDPQRLRHALGQLVTGVQALHDHGVIHRDLKPSNVMVHPEGRVVLLDFGLVSEQNRQELTLTDQNLSGTPAYMAPETAGGQEESSACDWYAVGVMLYESLCGQLPFTGKVLEILSNKRSHDAPPLPISEQIPQDLAELCMALLSRDPASRPDFDRISQSVALDARSDLPAVHDQRLPLIGRASQLSQLAEAKNWFEDQQQPLAIFVSGRSGEGKSVLAEQFIAEMHDDDSLAVISGRCYDRESVPFKALDSLIDGLCSYLRLLTEREAASLMPREIGLLAKVFPVLLRVEVVAEMPEARVGQLDEQQVRTRAFAALRELFARISDRTPIVAFIDDLQWGDADSAEVLFEVLRPPQAPVVMFVGTYRSDEAAESSFLKKWKELQVGAEAQLEQRDVQVGPFNEQQCIQITLELAGEDNPQLREQAKELARDTGGNPFLISELIESFDRSSQTFRPIPLHESIAAKLDQLPADAKGMLEVVAVSGQSLLLQEASSAISNTSISNTVITGLCNMRLLRPVSGDEKQTIDTYHDRIRETVLEHMEDEVQRGLHAGLAGTIETCVGGLSDDFQQSLETGELIEQPALVQSGRLYDLSYHFDAAGDTDKALSYAMLAAEQARQQYAPEVAAEQFAIAKRNANRASASIRYRIGCGRAEALHLLGYYTQAVQEVNDCEQWANSDLEMAELVLIQGFNFYYQGRVNDSIQCYQQALRQIDVWVPKSTPGMCIGILKELGIQAIHTLFPRHPRTKEAGKTEKVVVNLLNHVTQPYCFQSVLPLIWSNLTSLNRARKLRPSRDLGFAVGQHGMFMIMLGRGGKRATKYCDEALAIAKVTGDIWLVGVANNCRGIGLHALARYQEGILNCQQAIDAFQQSGDQWMMTLAHFHKGCCHFGEGNLPGAIDEAVTTIRRSSRIGDSRIMCASWLLARATSGDFDFERIQPQFPDRPDDVMSTTHGRLAEAQYQLLHGRTEQAVATAERAWADICRYKCFNSHTILILPMLAKAYRLHADAIRDTEPQAARKLAKRSLRFAVWAARVTRFIPAAYPMSLREAADCYRAVGKTRKALRMAEKSCRVAEKQSAKYEFALSDLLRAELKQSLGIDGASGELNNAKAEIDRYQAVIDEAMASVRLT